MGGSPEGGVSGVGVGFVVWVYMVPKKNDRTAKKNPKKPGLAKKKGWEGET